MLKTFLPQFNRKFAVPPAQGGSAYRPVPADLVLDEVFCFKYYRTVGADNVVTFGAHRIQIFPCNGRQNYHRARVEIQERMDGGLAVYYQRTCLAVKPAPAEAPVLRVQRRGRLAPQESFSPSAFPLPQEKKQIPKKKLSPPKPALDHPWRKSYKKLFAHKNEPSTDIFTGQQHYF